MQVEGVSVMIIRTEYANFGNYKDLLRFMQEENIKEVTVRTEYWGAKLTPLKVTQRMLSVCQRKVYKEII